MQSSPHRRIDTIKRVKTTILPKPRPVMIKTGREVLAYEEAVSGSNHLYTCLCASDVAVVWTISKEVRCMQDWLKRCQHPLSAQYMKARADIEKGFIQSRLGELSRAESLLQSFDGSSVPYSSHSTEFSPPKRSISSFRVPEVTRRNSTDPYENLVLVPHQVINMRFGQHFRPGTVAPRIQRRIRPRPADSRLSSEVPSAALPHY